MDKSSVKVFEETRLLPSLERRRKIGSIRQLRPYHEKNQLDFSSNDYLGLAQSKRQQRKVEEAIKLCSQDSGGLFLGSTGSRLLTGDSAYAQELEVRLAKWHKRPAALLCSSGYNANLTVLSCLTMNSNVVIDELAHNSMMMGIRLSKNCEVRRFQHNDVRDLERNLLRIREAANAKLSSNRPTIVVVESVYSMDGDIAPLQEILAVCTKYNACAIVDEAHGLGLFGKTGMGVLEQYRLEEHPALLCSVHTFGKAAGCHGAVICGSTIVKEFLLNYGRPIIYSTSQPVHSLITIACSYESMASEWGNELRRQMRLSVGKFRDGMNHIMTRNKGSLALVDSSTPIQALIIPGNMLCVQICASIWKKSGQTLRLYPIRSPTVPKGQERVRIVIHSHNTDSELIFLLERIEETLEELELLEPRSKL